MRKIILSLLLCGLCYGGYSQLYPERRLIRSGNKQFEQGKYPEAEVTYMRALEKTPFSYEANFNLSDVRYKQERYEEAEQIFQQLAEMQVPEGMENLGPITGTDPASRARAYYNLGNSLFQQRKLEPALEAYKNSLRLNPSDQEAKFNLAYTKKLLDKDKNGGGGGGGQNNQNDQNKNQDNQQNNPDNKDNNDQNKQNPDKNDQQKNPDKQNQGGMSKEEAEQLLDAVQNSEDNTREKVDAKKVGKVGRSGKNW